MFVVLFGVLKATNTPRTPNNFQTVSLTNREAPARVLPYPPPIPTGEVSYEEDDRSISLGNQAVKLVFLKRNGEYTQSYMCPQEATFVETVTRR